eukprot:scaffold311321_cov14-Tisochrysis_lutea.AAC.1
MPGRMHQSCTDSTGAVHVNQVYTHELKGVISMFESSFPGWSSASILGTESSFPPVHHNTILDSYHLWLGKLFTREFSGRPHGGNTKSY